MSKGQAKKLSYHSALKIPALKKYKTVWDLAHLYYKNASDPRIESDLKTAEKAYADFRQKWHDTDFTSNDDALARSLADYEELIGRPEVSRPGRYFSLRQSLNVNDHEADRAMAKIEKRLREAGDRILFFRLKLGQISQEKQKHFLAAEKLAHFRYYLRNVFEGAKHDLSEPEEKIIRLKDRTASSMWYEAVEKILSNREISFKGKKLPIPEALETIDLLPSRDRVKLWDLIMAEMKQIGEVAEHEMNAIVSDARGEDKLRGYKKPYSATVLSYEDDEQSLLNLVNAVSSRGFKLSQKFYRLKAKYHKRPSLHYTERSLPVGQDIDIDFKESVSICRDVFYGLKEEYGRIFDHMLETGAIDVFPKAGKRGGAFMSSQTGHPTQVLLNHVSNFKSLETLAHEMGHAIHSVRSEQNSPLYDGHSIITAETASTLFENLVFDAVYEQATEKQKLFLSHERASRDIATIERQIAFFNAELEIHETIEQEGAMTSAELAGVMYRHLKSYLGSAIKLAPEDGYSYVYIPHLRYGFYVYSYAYGMIMSTAIAGRYQEDRSYIKEIDKFLSAGSSASVSDIFASIGLNTKKEDTFLLALDAQEQAIKDFEKSLKL